MSEDALEYTTSASTSALSKPPKRSRSLPVNFLRSRSRPDHVQPALDLHMQTLPMEQNDYEIKV